MTPAKPYIKLIACNLGFTGLFIPKTINQLIKAIISIDEKALTYIKKDVRFTLIEPIQMNGWIVCKLVKQFPREEPILDEEERRLSKLGFNRAAYVWVAINAEISLLLFEEKPGYGLVLGSISDAVGNLLKQALALQNIYPEIKISPILSEHLFIKELKKIKTLEYLSFEIVRPNPKYRKIWDPVKNELDRLRADNLSSKYRSKQGLNLEESKFIEGALYMVEDGYGNATAYGKTEKQEYIQITSKRLKTEEVIVSPDIDEWLIPLKKFIDRIKKRLISDE